MTGVKTTVVNEHVIPSVYPLYRRPRFHRVSAAIMNQEEGNS